jgi:hypothetical protein
MLKKTKGAELLELELSSATLPAVAGSGRRLDFDSVLDYFSDNVDDLLELMPGETRADKLNVAAAELSGTGNKKSKAFRTSKRNLERWSPRKPGAKRRTPKAPSRERIKAARIRQAEQLTAFRVHGGAMRVKAIVYTGKPAEWVPRQSSPPVRIRQHPMQRVVAAWSDGEVEEAFELLWEEFVDQLGDPNVDFWEDVPDQGDLEKIELYPRG